MQFNLAAVPFSRCGAYMAIDYLPAREQRAEGIYLRTLHGDASCAEVCRIEFLIDEKIVSPIVNPEPASLRLEHNQHFLSIHFSDSNTVRFHGIGAGLRLSFDFGIYDSAIAWRDGWLINSFSNRMRYSLFVKAGKILHSEKNLVDSRWFFECVPDASGVCELALCEALLQIPSSKTVFAREFSISQRDVESEFSRWLQTSPAVDSEFFGARKLAAYVQWSSIVAPQGNFKRHAMLMSKHWFNAVWSWDHCFNAMALIVNNPSLAWDQFMLLFDQQHETGALPDCISDRSIIWNFCKPPIHGWTLRRMLRRGDIAREQLSEVYGPLARWTQWWFDARAHDDGLPQYFHGNDSGWDNASVFDSGVPVQSPDLAAFLIVQMDVLADIAQRLQYLQEALDWKQRADNLLEKMLTHYWHDDRFVALHDCKPCDGDSLLLMMPIVLGHRLPLSIQRELIAALKQNNRFHTEFGLASESVASDLYESDGYWRGPVWAPVVSLIVESLRELGEQAFADEIANRFCKTVARSGMAENFDALTGEGLRDRAHTWTASVFLMLAASLAKVA